MIYGHSIESNIRKSLADCVFFHSVEYHRCLTSTSDRAKELAQDGGAEGTVILAGTQTAGRGRMGRHFYSPEGSGLYMSILLRPDELRNDPGLLTACGAVAVWQAIYKLANVKTDIKWVNDLYYQQKKLCGILAEGQFNNDGTLAYVILGIGINITRPEHGYDPEIDDKTIALHDFILDRQIEYSALCAAVTEAFGDIYNKLPNLDFLDIYRKQSCVLGQNITYLRDGQLHQGKAIAIDDHARLVIDKGECRKEILSSGEISLVRAAL
ncbi:MAG: biotin--[acetyl-CoA-carboxylase] ligase [Ruminococcaceae bacterium]|nr:biotin--[acetyl-CoA-carboxylase] ligase [Oscillospiraceae bacterium]